MTLRSTGSPLPEIAALGPWFHNLHLPDGTQTAPDHPLGDFPAFKWAQLGPRLPADLTGWRALDIGCNAGFYSFELAKRGAEVVGMDADEHYLRQARWAARHLGLSGAIDFRCKDVYALGRSDESFDLVLFMGVLYHLRHPLLALDIVAERVGQLLALQTLTAPAEATLEPPRDLPFSQRHRLREAGWPSMAFVAHRFAGDPTNWWVPTAGCVEGMARSAGLELVERAGDEIWLYRPRGVAISVVAELDAALGR